jgi:hypothetical protein
VLVERLLSCYLKPPDAMIAEMDKVARGISEEDQSRIFESILDTVNTGAKIGVKDIRDACRRLGVSFTQAIHVNARQHRCDCCGRGFMYVPAPTDEQEIEQGWHDRCPCCGFQVVWTKAFTEYALLGYEPPWYAAALKRYQNGEYGPDKKQWFNRAQREKDRKEAAIAATEIRIRIAELSSKMGVKV